MANLIAWHGPITETGSTNSQTIDPEGGILEQRQHTFIAEFNEPASDEEIYSLKQMPLFYSYMVFKSGAISRTCFVVGREARQNSRVPNAYDVTINYANKIPNNQNSDKPNVQFQWITNPLLRPALVNWGSYIANEAVEIDEEDNPVTTTAGEPLVLEEQRHYRKLTITKNVRTMKDIFAEGEYINEEDTTIDGHVFKKLTLWLLPVERGQITLENGVLFFPITMTILHNPKTWIRRIRNAGYYMRSLNQKIILDPNDPTRATIAEAPLEPIIFSDGRKADRPVLLDRRGRPFQLRITGRSPNPWHPLNLIGSVANPLPVHGIDPFILEYEILSPTNFDRPFTKRELEESTRYFRTKKKLNFTKELPLQ